MLLQLLWYKHLLKPISPPDLSHSWSTQPCLILEWLLLWPENSVPRLGKFWLMSTGRRACAQDVGSHKLASNKEREAALRSKDVEYVGVALGGWGGSCCSPASLSEHQGAQGTQVTLVSNLMVGRPQGTMRDLRNYFVKRHTNTPSF